VNYKAKERNSKLPGMGGVFNSINLDAYHYAGQNPVMMTDPDGNSTWIDKEGVVKEVKNDNNLGIYRVGDNKMKQKLGETKFWDSFVSPDTGKPVGKIFLGESIELYLSSLAKEAKGMSSFGVARESIPNGKFDVKSKYPGHEGKSYHGFLFQGKYITLREAGNVLAGANAAILGQSFDDFQKMAGALHAGGISGLIKYQTYGKTYGNYPNYGECDYQRTRSEWGYMLVGDGKFPLP